MPGFFGTDKLEKQPAPLISARLSHYAAKCWYSLLTKPLTLRRKI